jgi:phytoene synthase
LAAQDLDAEVKRADPDRWLASRFIADRRAREGVIALYALDHQLARAEALAANPLAAEIRLTWWRDMAAAGAAPGHPLAETLQRRGLLGEALAELIEARIQALGPMDAEGALAWARQVQGALAVLGGRILGATAEAEPALARAGAVWGLVLLRRRERMAAADLEPLIAEQLALASEACRALPSSVYPAALCATLARAGARKVGAFETRLRLAWAVMTGRL